MEFSFLVVCIRRVRHMAAKKTMSTLSTKDASRPPAPSATDDRLLEEDWLNV
jgi:hypothetical protein